jgi:DNA-binding transcriptional MocR family regulator
MWQPSLRQDSRPLHDQLMEALARDVASGALSPGAQLPPQRDLAYRLKIGVGTVTKVYAEARRRGLLTATVGRGSFVAGAPADGAADALIDLSRNLMTTRSAAARFPDALLALRRRADLAEHLTYAPPAGMPAHRKAGAKWLAAQAGLPGADWQRLAVCEGGQHAMALAFASLCKPGDTVLTEHATFFGMKALAEQLRLRLVGLPMDKQGLLPDALDKAAAAGAKFLYTIPTLQNPTGRIMSARRRLDIAAIVRKRDLTVVEDDVYAPFLRGEADLAPIATLAPERTFYVSTLSKMIAPGLRCAYLLTPGEAQFERLMTTIRAFSYAPAALGALVATQWIEDGTAETIASTARRDVAERTAAALRILGKHIEGPYAKAAPHVWLPMSELKAERVAGAALRSGVAVTPPGAPIIDGKDIAGLRLCIGAPADKSSLERGLKIIAAALAETPDAMRNVV